MQATCQLPLFNSMLFLFLQIDPFFNHQTNCYEIKTHTSYQSYQQVFISYGCHSNQKLFIDYGFCLPDNPHNTIEISYGEYKNQMHNIVLLTVNLKVDKECLKSKL